MTVSDFVQDLTVNHFVHRYTGRRFSNMLFGLRREHFPYFYSCTTTVCFCVIGVHRAVIIPVR